MAFPRNDSELSARDREHGKYVQLGAAVFLVGNCFRSGAIAMFAQAGCYQAESLDKADLVCFLGGEDVDPKLYGEQALAQTYINPQRDKEEADIYARCVELGIPMFGICRGMQFIHVMHGGRLFQHVDNHGRSHSIVDLQTNEELTASSMHHQMCIAFDGCIPVATAKGHSGIYHSFKDNARSTMSTNSHDDLEAAYYPKIDAFCVQGHPEVSGYTQFTAWCMERVNDLLADVADRRIEDNERYTVKKDVA